MNVNQLNTESVSPDVQHQPMNRPSVSRGTDSRRNSTVMEANKAKRTGQNGGQQKEAFSKDDLASMAETINDHLESLQTKIGLTISQEYDNQVIVEIKNKSTNELIKQLPPEELLEVKEKMEDLTGIIFNSSV